MSRAVYADWGQTDRRTGKFAKARQTCRECSLSVEEYMDEAIGLCARCWDRHVEEARG